MIGRTIIEGDAEKYYGKFVAMPSFNDNRVIACDEDALVVNEKARQLGYHNPVIFFVADPKIPHIHRKENQE
jgi:hypothetical protein